MALEDESSWLRHKVVRLRTSFRSTHLDDAGHCEFPDGQIVLLTHVLEYQEATVLQLPAQPATAAEAKAQERVALVG
jgi:hypothetical protein